MAYPDDVLVDGEQVVLHRHPHGRTVVVPVLLLLLVVGLGSYLAAVVRSQTWAPWAWTALLVVGVVLVGRYTVLPVVRWRTTHFVVTTRRVLVREGVVTRHGMDIPLDRIDGVRVRQNLAGRALGSGTLVVESAAAEPLEFDDIPGVDRVHAQLHREVAGEA